MWNGYNRMKVADYSNILNFLIFILFSTHILACIWIYIGTLYPGLSWVYVPGQNAKNYVNSITDIREEVMPVYFISANSVY